MHVQVSSHSLHALLHSKGRHCKVQFGGIQSISMYCWASSDCKGGLVLHEDSELGNTHC